MRRVVLLALAFLASSIARSAEQRAFSMEEQKMLRPVPLPPEVMSLIELDSGIREVLSYAPSDSLLASEIHLHTPSEKDLVIMGAGPLAGANVTTFWIFRPTNQGYELLLNAAAHDLDVKSARSNGYRDIELLSATADSISRVLCKFNGETYHSGQKNPKPVR